jgi:ABC-type phosphate/phosphonate transport system substrate-binding protein
MDPELRKQIQKAIADIEARIPEAKKDLEEAERAGLGQFIKDSKDKLAETEAALANLKAVYGG